MVNTINDFRDAMRNAGLIPPDVIQPGKLHRFPGTDKSKSNTAARCFLFPDRLGGWFQDFSTNLYETWQAKRDKPYTHAERQAFKERCERDRAEQQAEEALKHEAAAELAVAILKAAKGGDPAQHPYVLKKAVPMGDKVRRGAWRQRGWTDALLIPLYGADGKIWTLEAISADGDKDYLKGGNKRGCFHPLGKVRGAKQVYVGEGLATVAAVHVVDGVPAVAAMDAGNLSAVAQAVRNLAPDAEIVLLADNDKKSDGNNPGLEKATKAAQAVSGSVAVPELAGRKCDFWDAWHERGADAVNEALKNATQPNDDETTHSEIENLSDYPPIYLFDQDGRKKSQATLLIELGQTYNLFHCPNKDGYALIGDHQAVMALRSRDFKEHLSHAFFKLTGKGCNANAMTDALATLESIAKFNHLTHPIHLRVSYQDKAIYLDMGCLNWRTIEVTPDGWRTLDTSPVKFVRKRGTAALPEPSTDGDITRLYQYINVEAKQLPLVLGWLLCALAGVKPYPILILQGEQGTGKSTTSRVLRALVDPSTVPLRSPPKDPRDLLVSASNNHVVVLDNLSGLSPELSDCLCRLSTGVGIDLRALYTDNEQILIDIQRPVLINGIDDIAARPDLAERALIINLPVIEGQARKGEREFWRDFEADRPIILAALLNAIAAGLNHRDNVVLPYKPRMADVAVWVSACERGLGCEGAFMTAHDQNQTEAIELGLESSPIGSAVMTLMDGRERWLGKPTELLAALADIAGDSQVRSKTWPQSPKGLSNAIKRLMPSFRKVGIAIAQSEGGRLGRDYKIEWVDFYPFQAFHPFPDFENIDKTNAYDLKGGTDTERIAQGGTDSGTLAERIEEPANPITARAGTDGTLGTDKNPLFTNLEVEV